MAAETHYVLHVLRAEGLTWESKLHPKKRLYTSVALGGTKKDTPEIENNLSPEWNTPLTFSTADDTDIFNIQLKHKSTLRSDLCIGYVDIDIGKLAEACERDEGGIAVLDLFPSNNKSSGATAGTISLKLQIVDTVASIGADVEAVQRTVEITGIANSGTSSAIARIDEGSRLTDGSNLYKSIGALLLKLDPIAKIIDDVSGVHPYAKAAWDLTSVLYKSVSRQFQIDRKAVDLARALDDTFDFVHDTETLRDRTRVVEKHLKKLLETTSECCKFLLEYLPHSFAGRILSLDASGKVDGFMETLNKQKGDLSAGLVLHNTLTTARTSRRIDDLYLKQCLSIQDRATADRHPCLAGTRVNDLQNIKDLLREESGPNIIWLRGVAGSGKSTIATSIEDYFRSISQLGAFLKFERGKSEPSSVIRELAFKLGQFDSSIGSHIIEHVEKDKDIASALLLRQFEELLQKPLNRAATSTTCDARQPVVIVLDALDECGTPSTRADLMRLLTIEFPKLPRPFRFLVTSRPDHDITKSFKLSSHPESIRAIELDYTSGASRHDVLSYLKHEMRNTMAANPEIKIPEEWPWDANIALLGEAAGGLFIWASTAVKFVSMSDTPFRKLKSLVLDSSSLSKFGLDELYATVLRGSGISWDNDRSRARFLSVISALLFSKVPLSNKDIDDFLGFPSDQPSHLILSRLRCLLSYAPGEPVHLFHASFSDYLQSPKRAADPWFIDIPSQKSHLAMRCFKVMEDCLHFNMCNLETSFIRNDDVPDLKDRVKAKIPMHLEYACTHWAQHLVEVAFSSTLLDELSAFAYQRLLFWFEVLSILKIFRRVTSRALPDVASWAIHDPAVSSFLKDASSLATVFADAVSQSTPHIYVSMLPLTKEDSGVSAHYSKCMNSMVQVERRGMKPKPMWLKVLEGHKNDVNSVCFSPDGKRIISGSEDGTIRIWDGDSGELVCNPLEGHTHGIASVAVSRDGHHVVSGSWDNTVRIWDLKNAGFVYRVLEGHTSCVKSVAFSPDGKYVVSGSRDNTVRLWDVGSGKVAFEPFEGHTGWVHTVAFSSSGKYIASGCNYGTIQIWDTESGKAASEPFTVGGDSGSFYCVAFSPDDVYIASGSADNTIRIWSVATGQVVSEPFTGHTDSVNSVAFSPDGRRVISGSDDNTIIIWDVEKGKVVEAFTGHAGAVTSVAFSPDGSHVVSGSRDRTIRVWDASSVNSLNEPVSENTSSIRSIAFSPDDSKIASACEDGIIRVWNAAGKPSVSRCLEGHTKSATCVAFSPDGLHIISGSDDGTIRIWESSTGAVVSEPYEGYTGGITSISVSSDGAYIASGSYHNAIIIWDLKTGAVIAGPFVGHTDGVTSVAFSPDGSRVVSGSTDCTLILWDAKSGDIILGPLTGHTGLVSCVAFSPDGSCFASGSWDRTIRFWNASTGDLVRDPLEGHAWAVASIAFSPDSSRIASGSYDETVRVWDVTSGDVVFNFEGHVDYVRSVVYSHDGKHIASSSDDGTIRVWNVQDSISASDVSNWTMASNGWMSNNQDELILWVPPDLRPTLLRSRGMTMFGCAFWTKVGFENASIGPRWRDCFKPLSGRSLSLD